MTDNGVHNSADMYEYFIKLHPATTITEDRYKKILNECFKYIVEQILEGHVVKLGQRLGELSIKKVRRKFKEGVKPPIDWGATNKYKKEIGENKIIYFTDDFWYRFYWKKKVCQVPNKTVYSFIPTKGPNGNRKKLVEKLKSDEFASLLYSE
ncbi:MAG: hypothetical protein EOM21_21270 [Gammaproteobacteria bacterium]|nr:hypothetical protein [Gammaproteobacteria bacterium]